MIIPFGIILIYFLVRLTIKKAQLKVEVNKHVGIRVGVLAIVIPLGFLILYLIEGRSGMLGALYLNAYFVGAWLLYLVVETISLFVVKQNKLARANLVLFSFVVFILAIVISQFA